MNTEDQNGEELEVEEGSGFMSYEDLMEARKITFSDVKEHLTGPVLSTVIHVVLLAFLGTIVVFKAPEKSKEITVEMKTIEPQEIEPPPPPPEPPEPVEIENPTETPIERPNMEVDVNVQVDNISVDNPSEIEMPSMLNMKMSNSALTLAVPSGGGKGGAVAGKFLGTGGSGSRFFFILDYSASMGRDRLLVLKSHLMKALEGFKGRGQVALLFFSGPVWLPQEDAKGVRKAWNAAGQNFHCKKPGAEKLYPKPQWFVPNKHNLEILNKYICQTPTTLGTNWSHPFKIALENMKEKPNVIFFMTDGAVDKNIVTDCMELVKKYGKRVTINTIGFGLDKKSKNGNAADNLEALANLSKGGVFKGYSNLELEKMASEVTLPTKFTNNTTFDYSKPRSAKQEKEKEVSGLTIE